MNHNTIKQVILDQIEVIKDASIVERDYSCGKNMN